MKGIPFNQKTGPSLPAPPVRQFRWMVDPAIDLISSDGGLLSSASLIATAGLMTRLLKNAPMTATDKRQAAGSTDPEDNGVCIVQ